MNISIIYLVLMILGCSPQQQSSICAQWSDKDEHVDCGYLTVPGDWDNPSGDKINLFYVRLKSTDANPKKDPIIFLQGGPGGSATSLVNFFLNSALRSERDIIIMDQRGTGYSDAQCADMGTKYFDALAADLTPQEELEYLMTASDECTRDLDGIFSNKSIYNSRFIIRDFEALRKHLGVDQWNILGASYGSRLGMTYLREYPGSVRAAALQGLFPPEARLYEHLISNMNRVLDLLFTACAANPACDVRHPELANTFTSTIAQLEASPYELEFEGRAFTINSQDYLLMVLYALYNRQSISRLPELIEGVRNHNNAQLIQAIRTVESTLNVINGAMYMSVAAYEELPFSGLKEIGEELSAIPALYPGPAFFMSDPYLLEKWHSYRAPELEDQPVSSDHPILLVSGELDPVTPPANAAAMLPYLPNARHIIFQNESHANFNPCYFHLLIQFFNNPAGELSDCYENDNSLTLN